MVNHMIIYNCSKDMAIQKTEEPANDKQTVYPISKDNKIYT